MKKLIALALAMLMLLASAAFAEPAAVTLLSDPQLTMTQDGQTMSVDLTGLNIAVSSGLSAEVPTIRLDVTHDDEVLMSGLIQIVDGAMVFQLDGMSNAYKASMGADSISGQAQEAFNALFANQDAFLNFQMPAFTGATIPKLDMATLLSFVITDTQTDASGATVSTISLPYETINQLLGMAAPYLSQMVPNVDTSFVTDTIQQLQDSNSGVSLGGTIVDSGASEVLTLEAYLVQDGTASEAALGALVVMSEENSVTATVQVNMGDSTTDVATLALLSEPDQAKLSLTGDVMGMASINFDLYPEDGLQMVDLGFSAQGQSANLSLSYGQQDGEDLVSFAAGVADIANLALAIDTVADGAGSHDGAVSFAASAQGMDIALDGKLSIGPADVELGSIANVAGAIDITTMDDAANEAFTNELQSAAGALIGYLSSIEPQAAA